MTDLNAAYDAGLMIRMLQTSNAFSTGIDEYTVNVVNFYVAKGFVLWLL